MDEKGLSWVIKTSTRHRDPPTPDTETRRHTSTRPADPPAAMGRQKKALSEPNINPGRKSHTPSICDGMDLEELFNHDSSDEEDDWHRLDYTDCWIDLWLYVTFMCNYFVGFANSYCRSALTICSKVNGNAVIAKKLTLHYLLPMFN